MIITFCSNAKVAVKTVDYITIYSYVHVILWKCTKFNLDMCQIFMSNYHNFACFAKIRLLDTPTWKLYIAFMISNYCSLYCSYIVIEGRLEGKRQRGRKRIMMIDSIKGRELYISKDERKSSRYRQGWSDYHILWNLLNSSTLQREILFYWNLMD